MSFPGYFAQVRLMPTYPNDIKSVLLSCLHPALLLEHVNEASRYLLNASPHTITGLSSPESIIYCPVTSSDIDQLEYSCQHIGGVLLISQR